MPPKKRTVKGDILTLYDIIHQDLPFLPVDIQLGKISATHIGNLFWDFNSVHTQYTTEDVFTEPVIALLRFLLRKTRISQCPDIFCHYLPNEAAVSESYYNVVLVPIVMVANRILKDVLDAYIDAESAKRGISLTVRGKTALLLRLAEYRVTIRSQHVVQDSTSFIDHTLILEPTVRIDSEGNFDDKNMTSPRVSCNFLTNSAFKKETATIMRKFRGERAVIEQKLRSAFVEMATEGKLRKFTGDPTNDLPQIALVVIEEKKPGTMNSETWKEAVNFVGHPIGRGKTALLNLRKISPQIRKYSYDAKTPWVIVTEFNDGIIANIWKTGVSRRGNHHHVASGPGAVRFHSQKLLSRAMVAYSLFHRLVEAGIVDLNHSTHRSENQ